ncbi:MAG: hypothetical protein ACQEQF_13020 [Bacillota bacterium]
MNIENVEIGMKVKAKKNIPMISVKKGDILTIKRIDRDGIEDCKGYLYFYERGGYERGGIVGICVDSFNRIDD